MTTIATAMHAILSTLRCRNFVTARKSFHQG